MLLEIKKVQTNLFINTLFHIDRRCQVIVFGAEVNCVNSGAYKYVHGIVEKNLKEKDYNLFTSKEIPLLTSVNGNFGPPSNSFECNYVLRLVSIAELHLILSFHAMKSFRT